MSAWGIGATAATRRGIWVSHGGADPSTVQPSVPSVDTLVKWIPGEVVAAYSAIVLALQPGGTAAGEPSPLEPTAWGWIVAGAVVAFLLVLGSGLLKSTTHPARLWWELLCRALFGAIAFGVWSFVVPGSWWYSIPDIAANKAVLQIAVGVVGLLLAMLFEGVARSVGDGDGSGKQAAAAVGSAP